MFLYIKLFFLAALVSGTAWITHKVDSANYEKERADAVTEALNNQSRIIDKQAEVSAKTQKDKDELQNLYDSVVGMLRGVHQSNDASTSQSTSIAIPSQGIRLLEQNGEFLLGFAKECANTEIERNDVINKYNALIK